MSGIMGGSLPLGRTTTTTIMGTSTVMDVVSLSVSEPITELKVHIDTITVTTSSTSTIYTLNSQKSVVIETVYYSANATRFFTAIYSTTRDVFTNNVIVSPVKSTITLDLNGSVVPARPTATRTVMITMTLPTVVPLPPPVSPTITLEVTTSRPLSTSGFTNIVKTF